MSLTVVLLEELRSALNNSFVLKAQSKLVSVLVDRLLSVLQEGEDAFAKWTLHKLRMEVCSLLQLVTSYLTIPSALQEVEKELRKAFCLSCIDSVQDTFSLHIEKLVVILLRLDANSASLLEGDLSLASKILARGEDTEKLAPLYSATLGVLKNLSNQFLLIDGKIEIVQTKFQQMLEQHPESAFGHFYMSSFANSLQYEMLHVGLDIKESNVKYRQTAAHIHQAFGSLGNIGKAKGRICVVEYGLRTSYLSEVLRAVDFLRSHSHANLSTFVGSYFRNECFYFVEDLPPGASLHQILHNKNPAVPPLQLTENQFIAVFRGVASGLEFLHRHNFIHKALCPRNILLGRHKKSGAVVKLCGNAVKSQELATATELMPYSAPEILFENSWSTSSDIYALAVSMWESLQLNHYPFTKDEAVYQELFQGKRPVFQEDPAPWIEELISQGWTDDASLRPSILQINATLASKSNEEENSTILAGLINRGRRKSQQHQKSAKRVNVRDAVLSNETPTTRTLDTSDALSGFSTTSYPTSAFSATPSGSGESMKSPVPPKRPDAKTVQRIISTSDRNLTQKAEQLTVPEKTLKKLKEEDEAIIPQPLSPRPGVMPPPGFGRSGGSFDFAEDLASAPGTPKMPPRPPEWVKKNRKPTRNARSVMLMLGVRTPPLPPRQDEE